VDVHAGLRSCQRKNVESGPRSGFSPVQAFQDFAAFMPYLPPELLQEVPVVPFVYSLQQMFMPEAVHRSISWLITDHDTRNREFQELIDVYLKITAPTLADTSPCYMSIWHTYIPSMAFGPDGSLALLHALVALAALQIVPFQNDPEKAKQRALGHYVIGLGHQHNPESLLGPRLDDAVLATSLLFAHFEVSNS
jgi:hypothetical protein